MLGMERAASRTVSLSGPDDAVQGGGRVTTWVVSPRLLVAQAVTAALASAGSDVELHAWESVVVDALAHAEPGSTRHVVVVFDEPDGADAVDRVVMMVRAGDVRVAVVVPDPAATWWLPLLDEPAVDVVTTATSLQQLAEVVARFSAGDRLLLPETRRNLRAGWSKALDNRRHVVSLVQTLTPQQLHVLELLADGHRVRDIARLMGLADTTVRSHVRTLREKLGAKSQIEAVAMLRQVDADREDGTSRQD